MAKAVRMDVVCRSYDLALDWLILQGYTRKAAERLLGSTSRG